MPDLFAAISPPALISSVARSHSTSNNSYCYQMLSGDWNYFSHHILIHARSCLIEFVAKTIYTKQLCPLKYFSGVSLEWHGAHTQHIKSNFSVIHPLVRHHGSNRFIVLVRYKLCVCVCVRARSCNSCVDFDGGVDIVVALGLFHL